MKRALLVAYHFPPFSGSSGVQRTLRFARYLQEFGWEPVILTAHPRVYECVSDDLQADLPRDIAIYRGQGWDAQRHFSLFGRYPGWLARPDRWNSWYYGAIIAGRRAIREKRPDLIWATYPIATAMQIGTRLARDFGLPLVTDFRDPMAQEDYPEDPVTRAQYARIEANAIRQASWSTFTTPSAVEMYQTRYPCRAGHISLLENGYDDESFAIDATPAILNPGCLTLLHSGLVYPSERDPTQLFAALARLKKEQPSLFGCLRVRFRAPTHDALLHQLADRFGVTDAIQVMPRIPYRDALAEMMNADGLLILQASNCNAQIPAKLYEFMRCRRPILSLTDPAGDTARVVTNAGVDTIAPLDNAEAIRDLLIRYLTNPASCPLPDEETIQSASRRGRTQRLATLFDQCLDGRR